MRSHSKALFAAVALLALLLTPSSALAAKGVVSVFGEQGAGAGQFDFPGGVAINQTTGDVYVADTEFQFGPTGGHRIEQFDAAGNFTRTWGWGVDTGAGAFEVCTADCQAGIEGSGQGQFSIKAFDDQGNFFLSPQIAIDQSDGSVYVADTGNDRIQKFSASGAFLDQFGSEGTADGQFNTPQGVAVDPASGDVYVADTDNNRIQHFDSAGIHLGTIGSTSGGFAEAEFFTPRRVAVDSTGRLYVLDNGNERIQRFTSTGAFDQFFASGQIASPFELAIDPASDHVFIVNSGNLSEFDSGGVLIDIHAAGSSTPVGLSIRSASGRLYASDPSGPRILVLDEVNQPTVSIEPVTNATPTEVTFHGIVNPQGPPNAKYRFEYSTDGSSWTGVPEEEVQLGEGTSDILVTQTATGLEPNTEYRVRLVLTKDFNAPGAISSEFTFKTDAVAPVVQALEPGVVTSSSAWIGAKINPQKSPTTYYIEYSTAPGFLASTSIPASKDASAGSGSSLQFVNAQIKDLQPEITYHYRVVATNETGTTTGESRSFRTRADSPPLQGLPDGRVWEKVSPADKAGGHISATNNSFGFPLFAQRSQAATHGDAVVFASEGKFGGDGGPLFSQYLARRGPDGWVTEGITSRVRPGGAYDQLNFFPWFAEDLSWGVAITGAGLNPGDPEEPEAYNLYVRNNDARTFRFIAPLGNYEGNDYKFVAASPNGSTVVFRFNGMLFQRAGSDIARPVGILPYGAEVPAEMGGNRGASALISQGFNPLSNDGSRIYFSPQVNLGLGNVGALYLREAETTTLVSGSERPEDDPEQPREAQFLGASKDGLVAFFASNEPLTDASNANKNCKLPSLNFSLAVESSCAHLYRWDATAPEGERLTDLTTADPLGSAVEGMTAISDDGTSVYFVAGGDLTGGGGRQHKLYLWREGQGIRLVADAADPGLWLLDLSINATSKFRQARVTPSGRFLAFASKAKLTSYDTNGTNQLYLYDSFTEKLTCTSCSTFSARSKASSWFLSSQEDDAISISSGNNRLTANLTPDGKRLIFDSKDALVSEDTNGAVDVYRWEEGEIHLLSSGTSAFASRLIDASKDGNDAFFVTEQKLVRSDKDNLYDLYNARVGGTPEPDITPPCVADECQGTPAPPPTFQTPSSSSFQGTGNASAAKPRCAKGKVRRRGHCMRRRARNAKVEKQSQKASSKQAKSRGKARR